jgi:predicted ATP-grasp superfamily ATP-dependent carboligase
MLARYNEELSLHCRLWKSSYESLWQIVSKDNLYQIADSAGIDIIPAIKEPDYNELAEWSKNNAGPYFIKPFYEGIPGCALQQKNIQLPDRESLLAYVSKNGSKALVIQRLIKGGDGFIFDCYGLADENGTVRTIASHRRWRQFPPDLGTTSYGEIPARIDDRSESTIFENTIKLVKRVKFHGIFGIEWLLDRQTGKFYLIDFNARPFSSVGHLTKCGLNLPLLAYNELIGELKPDLKLQPTLKHKYWVDFYKDLETFNSLRKLKQISWMAWLKSLLRCRSFAYWDWHDPGPEILRLYEILGIIVQSLIKKLKK